MFGLDDDDSPKQELAILEQPFTSEEKKDAARTEKEVQQLLKIIASQESSLATNFARLGSNLLKIRSHKYWLLFNNGAFRSFGQYIESIRDQVAKGRTQIYQTISVAEKLLPFTSESSLNQMGITKAIELKRFIKQTGKNPTAKLIAKAEDPQTTVEELRAEMFTQSNAVGDHPGTYFDLGGFYATAEEKKEILRAFDVATKVDPVIANDTPEWARKKEIIQRLCWEFLATHEAEVHHAAR